jgi:hypothetical protein
MFDASQSNMHDVTKYAPLRVVLRGAVKAFFGLWVMGIGAVAFGAALTSDHGPRQPGDTPWLMLIAGAALGIVGLAFLFGGLVWMAGGFARGCYLKAGPDGMAVRFPKHKWFGLFHVAEYQFRWDEIEEMIHFTRKVNQIPIGRELHIRLYGGKQVVIERCYFSASVRSILDHLSELRAQASR